MRQLVVNEKSNPFCYENPVQKESTNLETTDIFVQSVAHGTVQKTEVVQNSLNHFQSRVHSLARVCSPGIKKLEYFGRDNYTLKQTPDFPTLLFMACSLILKFDKLPTSVRSLKYQLLLFPCITKVH